MRQQIARTLISEAMDQLCELPVGGIGPDGYTLDDLDVAAMRGGYIENNATFDIGQRVYRLLETALEHLSEVESEAESARTLDDAGNACK